MCFSTYKTNGLLQWELTVPLLAMSEEMPELEQSGFPQTAMLKHQGEKAALYLSSNRITF